MANSPSMLEGTSQADINTRIVRVGRQLASALTNVLDAVPGRPRTPIQLATKLGVNKDLSHRVLVALRQKDPLAVAHLLPGPTPLRRFVDAGTRRGVPSRLTDEARQAIGAFDGLIREVAGDRADFDAIISAWLPEARSRFEAVAKQSLYRGARQLKGIAANLVFGSTLMHPSKDAPRHDLVQIWGYLGLRRIRPGAMFKVGVRSGASDPAALPLTLDGQPAQEIRGVFLDEFCSGPPVEVEMHQKGQDVVYGLKWGNVVGLSSTRDIVMAELRRKAPRRYRQPDDPKPKTGLIDAITVPSREYVFDLILHEEVYPAWEPRVRVLELGEDGTADPNDATRDFDVIDVAERIEPLGVGIERFRAAEIPNYMELLYHVCDKLGWNPEHFRGYRTRIDYPIFGSQIQFAFDLPIDPSAPASGA